MLSFQSLYTDPAPSLLGSNLSYCRCPYPLIVYMQHVFFSQQVTDIEAVVKRFKTELYNCVGFIQEPKKLKESVKQLYQKYVQDDTVC